MRDKQLVQSLVLLAVAIVTIMGIIISTSIRPHRMPDGVIALTVIDYNSDLYYWEYNFEGDVVGLYDVKERVIDDGSFGGRREQTYIFRGLAEGVSLLTLDYMRIVINGDGEEENEVIDSQSYAVQTGDDGSIKILGDNDEAEE